MVVVDSATHSQKDGVEGNGGSLKGGAEAFMLFLRGAELVLQSSVLTVFDFDEVKVTLEIAVIFGSVLSGEGGIYYRVSLANAGVIVVQIYLKALMGFLLRLLPSSSYSYSSLFCLLVKESINGVFTPPAAF